MNLDHYFNQFINLEKTGEFHYARDLSRMKKLAQKSDTLSVQFPIITITGSKGKTSTSLMIAALLKAAGLRVGLYTSPHVMEVNERIQMNGECIRDEEFEPLLYQAVELSAIGSTYFEVMTDLAMRYFVKQGVDIVVLEVGLGGRYDATNAWNAGWVALSPIGLEHQAVLGNDLKDIAYEKCGVIKPNAKVFSAQQKEEARGIILQQAPDTHWVGGEFEGGMAAKGNHQRKNAALAIALTQDILKEKFTVLDAKVMETVLRELQCPGRMEVIHENPRVIVDGAHNEDSAICLASTLRDEFHVQEWTLILGMLCDKKPDVFVGALSYCPPRRIVLVPVNSPRSFTPEQLAASLSKSHACSMQTSLDNAITEVMTQLQPHETLVISGSLYLVGEAKKRLARQHV